MIRVACDCETTGLGVNDPNGTRPDGVIQIGLAWRNKAGDQCSIKFECDPGAEYYEGHRADAAFAVNGYTPEKLKTLPSAAEMVPLVIAKIAEIEEAGGEKVRMAAYNSPFDSWFLAQAPWFLDPKHGIAWEDDLMVRAAKAVGIPSGENGSGQRWSLRAAMEFAQIERFGTAHDAECDAIDALHLAEWLDAQETRRVLLNEESPTDLVNALKTYMAQRDGQAQFPIQQGEKRGSVSPSDLWMGFHAYWKRHHGGGRQDDPFFREIKSPISGILEKIELDRLENAGLWVKRGEFVGDGVFSGKLDGRVEFPRGSNRWWIAEVKSNWNAKTLIVALSYPSNAHLDQMECYMRMTGINRALLIVHHMGDPSEPSQWDYGYRMFLPDDARWTRIQAKAQRFLALQPPNAPEPPCDCRPRCST